MIVTFLRTTGVRGLSLVIALNAGDCFDHLYTRLVALAKERVVLVQRIVSPVR